MREKQAACFVLYNTYQQKAGSYKQGDKKMVLSIVSIVANVLFIVLLNLNLYTDHATFPDGTTRKWERSPIERLEVADNRWLLFLQIFLAAVSIISAILVIIGINNKVVKIIQLVSMIASAVSFIIIMIVAGTTHPTY